MGTRIFPKFYAQELFYSPEEFQNIAETEAGSHMHTIAHALAKADPKRCIDLDGKTLKIYPKNGSPAISAHPTSTQ